MRPSVEDIFNTEGIMIRIYTGKEISQDPYENNIQVTYLNPIPVQAIVNDFTAAQAQWKMPGIKIAKAKEIMIRSKYRSLIELSQKIEIDGEFYEGWKENGKMQIRMMGHDTLRIYIYIKVI